MGTIQHRGATWGTSDGEVIEILAGIEAQHPSLVRAPLSNPMTVSTTSPAQQVTISDQTVVVRSVGKESQMPSVWRCSGFRPIGPGRTLIVTDTEGFDHRLGVVTLTTVLDATEAPGLTGLEQADIGSARWLVSFDDGARALLGQRLRLWRPEGRRNTVREELRWAQVLLCVPGQDMQIAPAGGGEPVSLGRVEQVVLLEV